MVDMGGDIMEDTEVATMEDMEVATMEDITNWIYDNVSLSMYSLKKTCYSI